MHHLSSRRAVARCKLASWSLLTLFLLLLTTFGTTACAFILENHLLMLAALWCIAGTSMVALFQWLVAVSVRCPLCRSLALARDTCSKHRSAKRLFGSHRLRVACTIIFMKYFRCPYCGEPTSIKVRQASPRRRSY